MENGGKSTESDALGALLSDIGPVPDNSDYPAVIEGRVIATCPDDRRLATVVRALREIEQQTLVLVTDDAMSLSDRRYGDWIAATHLSDAIAKGCVTLRQTELSPLTPGVIGDGQIGKVASIGDSVVPMTTAVDGSAMQHIGDVAESADPVDLDLPGVGQTAETLRTTVGDDVARDWEAAVDSCAHRWEPANGIQAAAALLVLVGARNRVPWADLVHAVDEIGLVSSETLRTVRDELIDDNGPVKMIEIEDQSVGRNPLQLDLSSQIRNQLNPDQPLPDPLLRSIYTF